MNETFDLITYIIEMAGVAAFAISGATEAFKNRLDIFGVCVLGVITALGGGMLRDVCLGIFPPVAFTRYDYAIVSIAVSLLTFFYSYIRDKMKASQHMRDRILNVVDAFGLGVFVVSGVNAAVSKYGFDNGYLAVCCAMLTAIGGGMIRDVLVMHVPVVLYKHIYALAAIAGGIVYYELLKRTNLNSYIEVAITVVLVVGIRIYATRHHVNLPQAKSDKNI